MATAEATAPTSTAAAAAAAARRPSNLHAIAPGANAGAGVVASSPKLRYPSTQVDYDGMHFLIIDAPVDRNLPQYISELKSHNVKHLVRTCEPTYDATKLQDAGIIVHEMYFPDGDAPPKRIVMEWMQLVTQVFGHGTKSKKSKSVSGKSGRASVASSTAATTKTTPGASASPLGADSASPTTGGSGNGTPGSPEQQCIAVHCQAGLGRAPALAAIALMERSRMPPLDAVMFIRERRKGAFNAKQMAYLEAYKSTSKDGSCVIS